MAFKQAAWSAGIGCELVKCVSATARLLHGQGPIGPATTEQCRLAISANNRVRIVPPWPQTGRQRYPDRPYACWLVRFAAKCSSPRSGQGEAEYLPVSRFGRIWTAEFALASRLAIRLLRRTGVACGSSRRSICDRASAINRRVDSDASHAT